MQCFERRALYADEEAASREEETEPSQSSTTELNISVQCLPRLVFLHKLLLDSANITKACESIAFY